MKLLESELAQKRAVLARSLAAMGRVVVAFSGGRDSVLILYEAVEALGRQNVKAVTAVSRIRPQAELAAARRIAGVLGISISMIETRELALRSFRANEADRCRICKEHMFGLLRRMAEEDTIPHVVDGLNNTELQERDELLMTPSELGVISPLAEAGLSRCDVRRIIESEGLPVPSRKTHCLASRISMGIEITPGLLERIARAEALLERMGFSEAIVRLHSDGLARIKVPPAELRAVFDSVLADQIAKEIRQLGFDNVAVDLHGT